MPVAAVAGAAIAIGVAAEATTVFTVAAAIGATAAAVGSVTGNKALMIGGSILGAVGGIGAIADSAGLFSSAASGMSGVSGGEMAGQVSATNSLSGGGGAAAASDMSGVTTAAGGGGSLINPVSSTTDMGATDLGVGASGAGGPIPGINVNPMGLAIPPGQTPATGVIDGITGTVTPGDQGNAASLMNPNQPYLGPQGGGEGGTLGTQDNPAATGAPGAPSTKPITQTPGDQAPIVPTDKASTVGAVPNESEHVGPDSLGNSGIWHNIMGFVKAHPQMTLGAIMAGGSFLSGAMSPLTPAQVNALNAQAARNTSASNLQNAQTGLLQWQQGNMQQPIPRATMINAPRRIG